MSDGENSQTILIADDEPRVREVLATLLKRQGYDVIEANDGDEAVEAIDENTDILLLDLAMPRVDGFEVTRRVRDNPDTAALPILMITGHGDRQAKLKALGLGVDDFITKPPDLPELLARVKSLLRIKRYQDEIRRHEAELEGTVAERTDQLRKALSDLERATNRTKEAYLETVYRLARAAEYRDVDTAAHLLRMSHCCAELARRLGLDEDKVETILYASPMHDVGKIGVPDSILLKPGKLDDQEWEIMKQHTVIGAKILGESDAELLQLAERIAMSHHEKFDGSGYPNGLRGEDIPLVGRICAVADVFDALCSARPYKEAFPLDRALDILREGRGAHFDPDIVEAFLGDIDAMVAIRERFAD